MRSKQSLRFYAQLLLAAVSILLLLSVPTLQPIVKNTVICLMSVLLILEGLSLWRENQYVKFLSNAFYIVVSIVLLFTVIHYSTKYTMLVSEFGFQAVLLKYEAEAKFIYSIVCFLQPILLPLPEAVTVPAGSAVFGSFAAASISLIGTTLGIAVMFLFARTGGKRLAGRLVKEKHLQKYSDYTAKSETTVLFLLFILPILPDEIICIGAGLGNVSFKKFFFTASVAKLITAYSLAYSVSAADFLSLSPQQLILLLSGIIIILFYMTKLLKKKWERDQSSSLKNKE